MIHALSQWLCLCADTLSKDILKECMLAGTKSAHTFLKGPVPVTALNIYNLTVNRSKYPVISLLFQGKTAKSVRFGLLLF